MYQKSVIDKSLEIYNWRHDKRLHGGERENFKSRHKTRFESKHTRCHSDLSHILRCIKGNIFVKL